MVQGRSASTSFTQQLRKVKEDLDKVLPIFLGKMATEIVRLSPVDSGAYVNSHTLSVNSRGLGGQFSGTLKRQGPRAPDAGAEKATALANLMSQIDTLSKDTPVVVMNNSVPHAYKVEYAGWETSKGKTEPYLVYQTAKSKSSSFLREAKAEAGLT